MTHNIDPFPISEDQQKLCFAKMDEYHAGLVARKGEMFGRILHNIFQHFAFMQQLSPIERIENPLIMEVHNQFSQLAYLTLKAAGIEEDDMNAEVEALDEFTMKITMEASAHHEGNTH